MRPNYKDLLIELFVPLAGADGLGKIGTGFPIAEDRILTAHHVLFGDGIDEQADFEIRWHHSRGSDEPAGKWQPVARRQIVFEGSTELDAAVIAYPFPPSVRAWCSLTARNHATGTRWESEGFANVGRRDDGTRDAVPIKGEIYSYASRARDQWLDVDAPPVPEQTRHGPGGDGDHDPACWSGASGSPVMVLSQVAGILTTEPIPFRGGRLWALPAARLLADESFRAAINYRAGTDRTAALVAVLDPVRRHHPFAIGALECAIDGTGGALFRDPLTPVDGLATALNDCNVSDLLRFARKAIGALKSAHPDAARALCELVQRLLPILYDHTAVDAVRDKVDDPVAVLVGLPVATAFVAETVMAGADDRETRWQPPEPGRELEGQLCLPNTPNCGIDATGARALESFEVHLRAKLCVNKLSDFDAAFCRCLSEFVPAEMRGRLGGRQPVLDAMAAQRLADLASIKSRYYYLFQLPQADEGRAQALATLARLKNTFQAVAFLELADDGELMAGEWTDFMPLQDILSAIET